MAYAYVTDQRTRERTGIISFTTPTPVSKGELITINGVMRCVNSIHGVVGYYAAVNLSGPNEPMDASDVVVDPAFQGVEA